MEKLSDYSLLLLLVLTFSLPFLIDKAQDLMRKYGKRGEDGLN